MNRTGAIPKLIGGARPKHRKDWIPSDDCRPMPSLKLIDKNQITPCCNRPTESSNSLCSDTSFKDSELSLVTNWDRPTAMTSSKCNDISELLPVEKREIPTFEEGLLIKIPALHPKWVEKKVYINYSPPPYPNENEDVIIGASEAWLEQIRFLEEDLIWLLSLPHYRFWSQIVYDKDVSSCLGSYLENGTRWFDTLPKDEDSLLAINTIHQLVFLLYVRMATHKESLNNYFTPSAFGHIIYDNYLFDIGKIIDLCSLYRPTNRPLLEKLVSNLFSCQPKYYEDLKTFVTSIKDLMDTIENKLGVSIQAVPLNLSQRKQSFEERMDTIDLLLEISSSLEALLNVFPNAAYNFHEQNFLLRLSSFYERVIPALGETFSSYSPNIDEYLEERILKHIQDIRINILAIFRQTLSTLSLPLQANITNIGIELEKQVEVFVNTLTNCVADKVFISDYTTTYDLEQDIKYFQDLGADVTSLNFVREAVHSVVAETLLSSNGESLGKDKLVDSGCIPSKDDTSGMNGYYAGQTESLSKVEIASLISSVKDLLSHLGNGFIKECLKYYNYSAEECLHALLEENLPKCLTELDRSLPLSESEANFVAERKKEKDSPSNVCLQDLRPLDSHSNIYDDDKCSSFLSENINLNIHKGKWKSTIENEKDQSLDEKMKSIARQYEISNGYSIYEDEEKYEPLVPQEYEDEYDDTYDDKEVGDVDNFSSDRKMFRMPSLKGKGALNTPGMNFLQESSSDEVSNDEEEANYEEGRVRHFIELPDKKANASCKRWYKPISDGEYCGDSMVFTRSLRKGEWDDKHCCSKASSTDGAFRGPDLGCAEKQRGQTLPDSAQTHCETRRRMQRKMMSEQHQNKQELQPRKPGGRRDNTFSSTSPPSSAQQSWRSDLRGDNETSGGRRKHKEESNHGKAQDPKYRYKMIHKNENKRNMAHAKFKGTF